MKFYREKSYKILVDILENDRLNEELEKSIYYILLSLKCDIETIIRQDSQFRFKNLSKRIDKENNEI